MSVIGHCSVTSMAPLLTNILRLEHMVDPIISHLKVLDLNEYKINLYWNYDHELAHFTIFLVDICLTKHNSTVLTLESHNS
jgi:hypothetical protein